MEFFMIEGNLVEHPNMSDELMKKHKAYTQKAMDAGMILFSGLKKSMDGAVFVMKAKSRQQIEDYLEQEPFFQAGIQTYQVVPFDAHYKNPKAAEWF